MYFKCILLTIFLLFSSPMAYGTELNSAVKSGDVELLEKIILEGAHQYIDVAYDDKDDGKSALMLAAELGNIEAVKVLLKHKAHINQKNATNGLMPLAYAAKGGNTAIVQLLIEHNATNNQNNAYGKTPLMYAVSEGHAEAAKLLLAYGVKNNEPDINVLDRHELSTLMYAVMSADVDIVKLILAHKADVNLKNSHGTTAIKLAQGNNTQDIAKLLREAGAKE